ncbi:hypothetical protein [Streptomyces sp. NBC_00162]|uniref:hypothetical protein n=1 Tax=Streptomyces sp. NBC_00162 TaxID=2903629 RepID=UPI00214B7DC1|nr:hypothetical protein [Streptomyces sp. NBC_00162]UUU41271.1 hypothetical protein JIW86_22095 [Streptomyces sp. NBC_00162]
MSTNRSRRIDRDTAEQLLGGAGAAAVSGDDALTGLLAAVSAPAGDGELPGEQAAMAAFRSAHLAQISTTASTPVATPRKRNMLTPAMLLCSKAAATVAAAALGGVAVAAGTGNLPAALGGEPASSAPAPSASAPASEPGQLPRALADSPEAVPAALAELCRAYAADAAPHTPSAAEVLAERRFAPLVAAAGGPTAVPGYCAPVLGEQGETPGSSPAAQPTDGPRGASASAKPSGKPSGKHEAGKPPGHPKATRTPGGPMPPQPRDDAPTTHPNP